jgi:hypothetical protein
VMVAMCGSWMMNCPSLIVTEKRKLSSQVVSVIAMMETPVNYCMFLVVQAWTCFTENEACAPNIVLSVVLQGHLLSVSLKAFCVGVEWSGGPCKVASCGNVSIFTTLDGHRPS